MNQEESKDILNEEQTSPVHEEALPEGHEPDLGTPEQPATTEDEQGLTGEEKWQHDAASWKDKYLRLYAEFDNFRKRSMKERSDLLGSASADVIKELLPITDDFDRAIKANDTVNDIQVVKEGFNLIHQKLYKKLESKGLKPIQAIGEPFDTDFHEAITQIPMPDMKGKVVDEVEKGYTLNDKVIRFSKVVIGQ